MDYDLDGWKEIASAVGVSVRTAQRLVSAGLPVANVNARRVVSSRTAVGGWLARRVASCRIVALAHAAEAGHNE